MSPAEEAHEGFLMKDCIVPDAELYLVDEDSNSHCQGMYFVLFLLLLYGLT